MSLTYRCPICLEAFKVVTLATAPLPMYQHPVVTGNLEDKGYNLSWNGKQSYVDMGLCIATEWFTSLPKNGPQSEAEVWSWVFDKIRAPRTQWQTEIRKCMEECILSSPDHEPSPTLS